MLSFLDKNSKSIAIAATAIAALLIFAGLLRIDIQHDDATYSFRAFGYFDFMDAIEQSSPVLWFEEIPAWSYLSFHDAPPLVFAIQHLFFKLFGSSTLIARLPFALAGIASVVLIYLIGCRLFRPAVGAVGAMALAVSSYHVWSSQIGYLEPIATAMALLAFYLLLKAVENSKWFIWFGIALGLMLLTKYTVLFILPVFAFYLWQKNKSFYKNKNFWISLAIAAVIFSPVVYYNIKMYQTRGHFDVQFARLFEQDFSDWPNLQNSGSGTPVDNFENFWLTLFASTSNLLAVMVLLAVFYLAWQWWKSEDKTSISLVLLTLVFLLLQFLVIAPSERFMSIAVPFFVLIFAAAAVNVLEKLDSIGKKSLIVGMAVLAILLLTEAAYAINTNILSEPLGQRKIAYSANRKEGTGFEELQRYLYQINAHDDAVFKEIKSQKDIMVSPQAIENQTIYMFDPNLRWFSTLWYLRRWNIYYHNQHFYSAAELVQFMEQEDPFKLFKDYNVDKMVYVRGSSPLVFEAGVTAENQQASESLVEVFLSQGATVQTVNNKYGDEAFKIYTLDL